MDIAPPVATAAERSPQSISALRGRPPGGERPAHGAIHLAKPFFANGWGWGSYQAGSCPTVNSLWEWPRSGA
eukprot:6685484-Pyramimonas_sp.AAC.1